MSEPTTSGGVSSPGSPEPPPHEPFVPPSDTRPEFTWPAVLAGTVLGIIFGASSLYLVLKVGLTVSASFPSRCCRHAVPRHLEGVQVRNTTILENNVGADRRLGGREQSPSAWA